MQISIMDLLQATVVAEPVQAKAMKADVSTAEAFALVFAQLRGETLEAAAPTPEAEATDEAVVQEVETEDGDGEDAEVAAANTTVGLAASVQESPVTTGDEPVVQVSSGFTDKVLRFVPLRSTVVARSESVAGGDTQGNAEAVLEAVAVLEKGKPQEEVLPQANAPSIVGDAVNAAKATPVTTASVLPVVSKVMMEEVKAETAPAATVSELEKVRKILSLAKAKVEVEASKSASHKADAPDEAPARPEFPADLRVANIVRQLNPELVPGLNQAPLREGTPAVLSPDARPDSGTTPVLSGLSPSTERAEVVKAAPEVVATPRVPLADLQDTVVRQVKMSGVQQDRTLTIKLVPESLGEVQLQIKTSGGETTVHLVSANAAVRDTLESQVHLLRETLVREGIELHRVHVTSTLPSSNTGHTGGHETPGQQQSQWSHARHFGNGNHPRNGGGNFQPGGQPSENPESRPPADGSLNLFV